jgi:membrane protein involved in colicin uptake
MAIDPDDVVMKDLAEALNHPEGGERYQRAKAELNYLHLKAQTEATKAQRETIAVQKAAAEAEAKAKAKAAQASIIRAKAAERAAAAGVKSAEAAERNAKYMLASVIVSSILAVIALMGELLDCTFGERPRASRIVAPEG